MNDLLAEASGHLDPERVLEHLEDPDIRAKWPLVLADILDVLESEFRRRVKAGAEARELAVIATIALARHIGGRPVHLPRGVRLEQAIRDREIFRAWRDGRDVTDLARAHSLDLSNIYKIIGAQRAIARQRETDLFGFDDCAAQGERPQS